MAVFMFYQLRVTGVVDGGHSVTGVVDGGHSVTGVVDGVTVLQVW